MMLIYTKIEPNPNFFDIVANGLAMNSTGANWHLLSDTHVAKSFGFVLFFSCPKRNPKDFATFQIYAELGVLKPKPVLFIGFVVHRYLLASS